MPNNVQQTGGGGGNSALALIVGALAVAIIIGAFFWFSGDTDDTAITMDQPDVTVEEQAPSPPATQPTEPEAPATDQTTTD